MGIPSCKEARVYYRAGMQRAEESHALLELDYTTAAVYLGGYGVECMLKALIISASSKSKRRDVITSFRGGQGHDLNWLKRRYLGLKGAALPREVLQALLLANTWSTDLRYQPRNIRRREAEGFLRAVRTIVAWADRRI